jgi:hypothetical protein
MKIEGRYMASQAERRGSNRHPFIAVADVVELGTGALFSTRTTDLGPGGCFVDTLVPFDAGSNVRVTIREAVTDLRPPESWCIRNPGFEWALRSTT